LNDFNGKGASKSGNRWNSKGTEIIYSAESRALAMAEVAVHLSIATLPGDYVMIEIEVPDTIAVMNLEQDELPDDWNTHPHSITTQKIGDEFIDSEAYCLLRVPSAVVKGDFNYLINPHHKDFNKIKIVGVADFPFDKRLFE
jgi:RES domain-containing protein